MSNAWQFWPGFGRNVVNPVQEALDRKQAEYASEEAELQRREEQFAQLGKELGEQFGFKFAGVSRRDPWGTSRPRPGSPGSAYPQPPKRMFEFTFYAGPDGLARWKVLDRLAPLPEGVSFWGKLSWGWRISMEAEGAADRLAQLRAQVDQRAEAKEEAAREKAERQRKEREERAQRRAAATPEEPGSIAEALRKARLIE